MRGLTLTHVCHCGFFAYLVLFSYMSLSSGVSFDLTELRNKVAKIRVNPRGNLWATGHFMGKKSVMDSPVLASPEDQGMDALQVSLPAQHTALGELFQDFLRFGLKAQVDTDKSSSNNQEAELLAKILQTYIQSRK